MKFLISILGIIITDAIKSFLIWNNCPFIYIVVIKIVNGLFGFIFLNSVLEHIIANKKLLMAFRIFLIIFAVFATILSCIQLKTGNIPIWG